MSDLIDEGKNDLLNEVLDEIENSLKDPRGIVFHQRRLAFALSLGSVQLLERFLKKKSLLKTGGKINHLWLKKKKENVKNLIDSQTISSVNSLENFDSILDKTYKIEKERNELAYGKSTSEKLLRELINIFLDIKKEVEHA